MKILVNVARARLSEAWVRCTAVKLEELHDGSFDLMLTEAVQRVTDEMLDRALDAFRRFGDIDSDADFDGAMREAIAAALEVEL
jgi:hypothetical protein